VDHAISNAKNCTVLLHGVQSVRRTYQSKLRKANATTKSFYTVAAVLVIRQLKLKVAEHLLFGGTFVAGDLGG
jgi:hypothetical protein